MAGKPRDNPDKASASAATDTHKLKLVAPDRPSPTWRLPDVAAAELRELIRALHDRQSSRRRKSPDDESPRAA